MRPLLLITSLLTLSSSAFAQPNWAEHDVDTYKITITNLTRAQPMAPVLATTHRAGLSFFQLGAAPTPELASLAEAGNSKPMAEMLMKTAGFADTQIAAGGLPPGKSISMTVTVRANMRHLSLAAMLGNTNDAFMALRDVALPKDERAISYFANAYDAGSETNDEFCNHVPGPACGGVALSPEDAGEGYVYVHNGIHGIGGLNAALYDWRNPVARIEISKQP